VFRTSRSDEQLMKQFILGDEDAFSLLADRYAQPIFRFVFSMVRNQDDAEELTQEVFLKVVRAKHSFDLSARQAGLKEKFRPWLYRIARNQCLDAFRKRQRLAGEGIGDKSGEVSECSSPEHEAVAQPSPSPREEAIKRQEQEHLEQALQELDGRSRELLHLRFYQGLSYKEIAATLGLSENSVGSALIRAVQRLKEAVFSDNGRTR
jgi:RNA polymerase sigma-70 factor (ECF subfamily)